MGLFDKFKKRDNSNADNILNYAVSDYEYNGISVEVNDEESLKHLGEDFACIQREGIEKIITERFIPWFKGEDFADKDDKKIFDGLRVYSITYTFSKINADYSPTKQEDYFGQFEFDFESSSEYTSDMLEATAMEIYINNGKVVQVSGFEI